jgi:hypothetical protein
MFIQDDGYGCIYYKHDNFAIDSTQTWYKTGYNLWYGDGKPEPLDDAISTILNPTNIIVKGKSNFGVIDGEINIPKRSGKIYIRNITNSEIKKFLKKDKKGYYYYAKF